MVEDSQQRDRRRRIEDKSDKRERTSNKTTQQKPAVDAKYHSLAPRRCQGDESGAVHRKLKSGGPSDLPANDSSQQLQNELPVASKTAAKAKRQPEKKNTTGHSSRKQSEVDDARGHTGGKHDGDVRAREGAHAQKEEKALTKAKSDQGRGRSDGESVSVDSALKASSTGTNQPAGHHSTTSLGSGARKRSGQNATRGSRTTKKKPGSAPVEAPGTGPLIPRVPPSEMEDFRLVAEQLKDRLEVFFKGVGAGSGITPEVQTTLDRISSQTTDVVAAANQILRDVPGSELPEADAAKMDSLARQVEHARLEAASAEKKLMSLLEKNAQPRRTGGRKK